MDISSAEQVAQTFAPLGFALHEVMPQALARAQGMMKVGDMSISQYPTHFAHNVGGAAHRLLCSTDTDEWTLGLSSRKKELHFSRDLWSVRMLHRGAVDIEVPGAGVNKRRRAFYTNALLANQGSAESLLTHHGFLITWTPRFATGEVELELVHTTSPWKYGSAARIDLRMPLAADGESLATLRFDPLVDDDLDGLGLIDGKGIFQQGAFDEDAV